MKKLIALSCAALFVAVGCSNPADNKPAATIGDAPAVETAPDAAETAAPAEEAMTTEAAPLANDDAAGATAYTMNAEDTYIGFTGSKSALGAIVSHYGQFPAFEGTVVVTGDDLSTTKISVALDMTELTTDNKILTTTLQGETFFNVAAHPTCTFESTGVAAEGDGFAITGTLDLLGTKKTITFPATLALDGDTFTGQAEFTVDRQAWGLGASGVGDYVIKDEVVLTFDIVANAAA